MRIFIVCSCLLLSVSVMAADNDGSVTQDNVKQFDSRYESAGNHTAIENAIVNNKLKDLALNRELLVDFDKIVNFKLKSAGITNQESSGRCWMFSGLNVFTPGVMEKLNSSDFEFSQSYLAFWDKLEKANLYLEQVIAFRDLPIDDRKMQLINESPVGDGGWWTYMVGLINKYGVVPKTAMPETRQSSSTGTINSLLDRKLRQNAAELRAMSDSGKPVEQLRQRKVEMLSDVYQMLVLAYGKPPTEFTFRYESKDTTPVAARTYSPKEFRDEFLPEDLPEYVALCDNPNKAYDRSYKGDWSRNMYELEDFTMLNVPAEKMKTYAMKALLDSQVVWFACDVGKDNCGDSALFATGIYQYDQIFGTDFHLTKAQRLAYLDGYASHAMVLMGVDTAGGKPAKWLVENSWGTKAGDKGFWYMYDDWFDPYVYVLVVPKKYLDDRDRKNLELKPEITPMWDPLMQSLKKLK